MRWEGWNEPTPSFGDTRQLAWFALLPTPVEGGHWVWLEVYDVEQVYVRDIGNGDMFESGDPGWKVSRRMARQPKDTPRSAPGGTP